MESVATLEDGQMVYKDKDGNSLYTRGEKEGYSLKGTLIPKSNRTDEGGSTGFDIEQPMPIIVDPNYPERQVINPIRDNSSNNDKVEYMLEATEFPYTVGNLPPEPEYEESHEPFVAEQKPTVTTAEEGPKAPLSRVAFDLGDNIGEFECFYHRVFKDGVCLVLVWDNRYHGSRYNPSSKLRDAVDVYVGKERDRYNVLMGPRFTDDFRNEEYLILFIKSDKNGKNR